jgi:hypothetical protein
MRTLLLAAATGLFLTIGAASAEAQTVPFRMAIDGIGNAEPPAVEAGSGSPGSDFGLDFAPAGRGRVIVDSAPVPIADRHLGRRKMWLIER